MHYEVLAAPKRNAVRTSTLPRRLMGSLGAGAVVLALTACGAESDSADSSPAGRAAQAAASQQPSASPGGFYKFGQTINFDNGSTLVVENPVDFQPGQNAVVGEKRPVYVKFKATFVNHTKDVYDPVLTTASALADGEEGQPVFQDDLDAPEAKVPPGKSVTWWMGYGIKSRKDLQLGVSIGFADNATVVITA